MNYTGMTVTGNQEPAGNDVYRDLCRHRVVKLRDLDQAIVNMPILRRADDGLSAEKTHTVTQWSNEHVTVCQIVNENAVLLRVFDRTGGELMQADEAFNFLDITLGDNTDILNMHAKVIGVLLNGNLFRQSNRSIVDGEPVWPSMIASIDKADEDSNDDTCTVTAEAHNGHYYVVACDCKTNKKRIERAGKMGAKAGAAHRESVQVLKRNPTATINPIWVDMWTINEAVECGVTVEDTRLALAAFGVYKDEKILADFLKPTQNAVNKLSELSINCGDINPVLIDLKKYLSGTITDADLASPDISDKINSATIEFFEGRKEAKRLLGSTGFPFPSITDEELTND